MAKKINNIFDKFMEENPEFPKYIIDKVKKYLPSDLTENDAKRVLESIKEEYEDSLITPYEAIGIITAQSIGEPATQMTLNVFHFAGVASHSVEGLPRLIEILDAKKNLSAPSMKVYLTKEYNKDEEKVRTIAEKIKETKLEDFVKNYEVDLENKIVKVEFDLERIEKKGLDFDRITKFNDKKLKRCTEVIDKGLLKLKGTAAATLKDLMNLKESVLSQIVSGIKGIKDVVLIKEEKEFVIMTSGVALRQVMNIEGVDKKRVYCNDPHEVLKVFGIEAARQVIIEEFLNIVSSQGLSINERHVLLIADLMTHSGTIKGVTRYGIVIDKQNVLTRASFETPLRHLAQGALENEVNRLTTITENVMTNQMVKVGTGIPKISVKRGDFNK